MKESLGGICEAIYKRIKLRNTPFNVLVFISWTQLSNNK